MEETTATRFRMPETLSRAETFKNGRTAPATKMTNEIISSTKAMIADQMAAIPSESPKVPTVPEMLDDSVWPNRLTVMTTEGVAS